MISLHTKKIILIEIMCCQIYLQFIVGHLPLVHSVRRSKTLTSLNFQDLCDGVSHWIEYILFL